MLTSSFALALPLVDHCCGVCVLKKDAHTSEWCIQSDHCVHGCKCGNYTADCDLVADLTGMNDTDVAQFLTVLCTPCTDQQTGVAVCDILCHGECLVKEVEGPPGHCIRCYLEKTCAWSGAADPPPNSACDCNIDCDNINCVAPGTTLTTYCEVKTNSGGPVAQCPSCTGGPGDT